MKSCGRWFIAAVVFSLAGCTSPAPPQPLVTLSPATNPARQTPSAAASEPPAPLPSPSASASPMPIPSASAIAETPPAPRVIVCADCNMPTMIPYVQFDHRQSKILKPSVPILEAARDVLLEHPDVRIEIRGHIDASEEGHGAKTVGLARAEAVKKWFVEHGIDPNRLVPIDYGSTQPLRVPHSEADRQANRRVEFRRVLP